MEKLSPPVKRKRIPRAKSAIERAVWQLQGLVCGVDEVGRGCLAGPVVAAAVVLQPKMSFMLLKDSKLLTKEQRVRAARWIKEHSWYAYGVADHAEIDLVNIYQATLLAMERAVMNLCVTMGMLPAKIIVDAMPLKFQDLSLRSVSLEYFPFAEQQSISVAAASILAKVKRDAMMNDFEKIFPGYALSLHKGYATKKHRGCILDCGRSIIHRCSFCDGLSLHTDAEKWEKYEQINIFCGSDRELPDAF